MVTLVSLSIYLNLFFKLKDLYDEFENMENNAYEGSILSYFCLNTGAICLCVFLILTAFNASPKVSLDWNVVAVPLYVLLGISFFTLYSLHVTLLQSLTI
jgi:hypothetical protein